MFITDFPSPDLSFQYHFRNDNSEFTREIRRHLLQIEPLSPRNSTSELACFRRERLWVISARQDGFLTFLKIRRDSAVAF